MKLRIISGMAMLPFIAIIILGGYPLIAACFLIGLVGVKELFNGFRAMDIHPNYAVAVAALVSLYAIHLAFPLQEKYLLLWLVAFVMISCISIFRIDKHKIEDALTTMLGIIYVEFFSFHVAMIDSLSDYKILIYTVFISAFGSDICAYFTGFAIGKHKLCPNLSPKKTVEGAVGGVIGAALLCLLFAKFFAPQLMLHCFIIGVIGAALSQCGDLTASAFKRKMGIKDYGKLIPGHGGIMDRFDSILFTGPIVYYYITLVLI
ncbi:MAG: phosphatidate cytidylyltransferase [Eubacterium sp.]|nr:phosphatidate cytidylyltransferase [Eubacterium sp.]